ncbi:MAG: LCP family protein [Oscillospiraceae bacterium]
MSDNKNKKGGAHLQKKEKKPRTRKEKIRLAVILVLVILLALLLILFAVYRAWAKPPVLSDQPSLKDQDSSGNSVAETIPGVEVGGGRKEDFYTFLVVGRDTGGGGNTDTILLVAYDIPNQKLNVMSIPRDTMVNIPYDIKRINAVYNYAGGGDEGIRALYTEVSQLVGFVPDYEVVVEWKAVGELVEAIDGVWFDVPRNMNYDDPTQDLHIHINKGYQLLDGEQAMGVLRWRQNNDGTGYVTGDIGRIETQQAFLKEVVAQCLKIENVAKIQQFAKIFTENVQTDLTVGNLVWFAEQAIFGGLTMENVNFITLPGNYNATAWSRTYQNYQSYVLPDAEQLLAVVNESFNPYLADRTVTGLDIMSVNKDGSLSSSTGVVEDTKAAQPPVKPSSTPEPSPEPSPEVSGEPEVTGEPENTGEPAIPEGPGTTPGTEEPGVPEEPAVSDEPSPEPPEPAGEQEETPIPPPPPVDEAA